MSVNTPLQLAEALALFIRVEDLDRTALLGFAADPYFDDLDAARSERCEIRLHLKDPDQALALAEKYALIDDPILSPADAPTHVHHRHRGQWHRVRIELVTVEELPEPATDPGDDLAALGDEDGDPA